MEWGFRFEGIKKPYTLAVGAERKCCSHMSCSEGVAVVGRRNSGFRVLVDPEPWEWGWRRSAAAAEQQQRQKKGRERGGV